MYEGEIRPIRIIIVRTITRYFHLPLSLPVLFLIGTSLLVFLIDSFK